MAIEVFGAGAVQSAYVSYLSLDITANSITLLWPTSYVNVPYIDPVSGIHYNVLAASMNVTTGSPNVHTITLPDATMSSVGSNFIITNVGLDTFDLLRSDSSVLQVIGNSPPTSNSYWVQLTNNSTPAGVWSVITFGAGTSNASAAALAGNGLIDRGAKLNTDIPIVLTNPLTINAADRAKLILWTGGSNTVTLPALASVSPPTGYYVSFNNQNAGSSQLVIQPHGTDIDAKIDGDLSIIVQVQQSLTIISDGVNWWTLGFGQNQFAVTSSLDKTVAGSANVTLTNIEASSLIQNYTGALTGNITVFFPVTTNYWFVNNATSGPHTLSVQIVGPLGTPYVVPQGSSQIFYSDGMSMFPIPTSINLAFPLPIPSGGTGAATPSAAATAILPSATDGSIIYWSQVDNAWNILPIGLVTQKLTVVDVGAGRLLPRWA